MKKESKTMCPICKRKGNFGLMKDANGNLMCKWCYRDVYGNPGYTIELGNPRITVTNDDFSKLKDKC